METPHVRRLELVFGLVLGVLVLAGASYGAYILWTSLSSTKATLATTVQERTSLATELEKARAENTILADKLSAELAKNEGFSSQIIDIASTVGTLTKLSQTDKELLQKYSRVYFLNENYIPSSLTAIDGSFALDKSRTYRIHSKVQTYLENMLADAQDAHTPLLVLSAYRSFGDQASLKTSYKLTYGSGSNKFSADQGYSEHQLGTAVDLTTTDLKTTTLAFAVSPAGLWLSQNAYRYGFILSYPKGNTFYQYEPWHWRFVGVALATKLHDENKHFYDLPQRDIDGYLASIFD